MIVPKAKSGFNFVLGFFYKFGKEGLSKEIKTRYDAKSCILIQRMKTTFSNFETDMRALAFGKMLLGNFMYKRDYRLLPGEGPFRRL
jgi:hypothetical protein